jgi:hypothetical protein
MEITFLVEIDGIGVHWNSISLFYFTNVDFLKKTKLTILEGMYGIDILWNSIFLFYFTNVDFSKKWN